jgi:hypothetical protein
MGRFWGNVDPQSEWWLLSGARFRSQDRRPKYYWRVRFRAPVWSLSFAESPFSNHLRLIPTARLVRCRRPENE